MKRRKRTSDESSLPVVNKGADGKFSVEVAEGCFITWWMERQGDQERWRIQVRPPNGIPVHEVDDGAIFITPATH